MTTFQRCSIDVGAEADKEQPMQMEEVNGQDVAKNVQADMQGTRQAGADEEANAMDVKLAGADRQVEEQENMQD